MQSVNVDILPDVDATRSLGSSSKRWKDGYFSGTLNIGGNVVIGGDLQVGGNDILDSGGTTRITLGDPVLVNADISIKNKVKFTNLTRGADSGIVGSGYGCYIVSPSFTYDTSTRHRLELYRERDGRIGWYDRTIASWLMYITEGTGDLWIKGSYLSSSPELPTLAECRKNPDTLYKEIYRIAKIPSSKGKPLPEDEELRQLVLEKAFAKDISKTALLNARLVVILYEKVKQLEEENKMLRDKLQKLEQELQEIKQALAR